MQARLGSSLEQAAAEARGALEPKRTQLGAAAPEAAAARADEPAAGDLRQLRLTVKNRLGLHARPATRLVQLAAGTPRPTSASRTVTAGRGPVSARSLNGVAMLGARKGHELLVSAARGIRGAGARRRVRALAEDGFGDAEAERGAGRGGRRARRPRPRPGHEAG